MTVYLYVCLCAVCGAQNPEEGVRHPGDGATEDCEPPCDSWELNLCLCSLARLFLRKRELEP